MTNTRNSGRSPWLHGVLLLGGLFLMAWLIGCGSTPPREEAPPPVIAFERAGNLKDVIRHTSTQANELHPAVSFDDKSVLYSANSYVNSLGEERWQVWALDLLNGGSRLLTNSGYDDIEPAWHNENCFVYASTKIGEQFELWEQYISGAGGIRLISGGHGIKHHPAYNQVTGELAFVVTQTNVPYSINPLTNSIDIPVIWVASPNTSGLRLLCEGNMPVWSPDGRRLAFCRLDGSGAVKNYDIWTVNNDGTDCRRLTSSTADEREPSWCPRGDGEWIAFASNLANDGMNTGNYDIWVMRDNGGSLTQLTDHPADERSPSWGHDRIFYISNAATYPDPNADYDIWSAVPVFPGWDDEQGKANDDDENNEIGEGSGNAIEALTNMIMQSLPNDGQVEEETPAPSDKSLRVLAPNESGAECLAGILRNDFGYDVQSSEQRHERNSKNSIIYFREGSQMAALELEKVLEGKQLLMEASEDGKFAHMMRESNLVLVASKALLRKYKCDR